MFYNISIRNVIKTSIKINFQKRDVIKMCGRFVIDDTDDIMDMRRIFETLKKNYSDTVEFQNVKKGEIFPSDTVPVIIPKKEDYLDAVPMQWGIKGYNGTLVINARSEGVYQKKMFNDSIVNKRCIIPSNGFFEWGVSQNNQSVQTKKEKYLIKPINTPMLYFAGIYEKLPDPADREKELVRFVIMTKEARGLIRSLHSRMPVAIERKDILKWLNGNKNDINEFFTDPNAPEYSFTNLGKVG